MTSLIGQTLKNHYQEVESPGCGVKVVNVQERVMDWYDAGWNCAAPPRDPPGYLSGADHVQQRGACNDIKRSVGITFRDLDNSNHKDYDSGFRCAMNDY